MLTLSEVFKLPMFSPLYIPIHKGPGSSTNIVPKFQIRGNDSNDCGGGG